MNASSGSIESSPTFSTCSQAPVVLMYSSVVSGAPELRSSVDGVRNVVCAEPRRDTESVSR